MKKEIDFKFWGEDPEEDKLLRCLALCGSCKELEKHEEPGCWDRF
jgi:hypothetical protein